MSPTSYLTAPPRNHSIREGRQSAKLFLRSQSARTRDDSFPQDLEKEDIIAVQLASRCHRWQGNAVGWCLMTLGSRLRIRSFVSSPRFFAPAGAEQDAESFLARARAFLALGSFLAIDFNPAFPSRFANVAYVLLFLYVIHSLLALISVRYRRRWMSGLRLHIIDVLLIACIPVFIQAPTRAFFLIYPFLLFVLLAAAYRWGLYETLATVAACIALLVLGDLVSALTGPPDPHLSFAQLGIKDLVERGPALFLTACVVGYLGEEERGLAKAAVIARLTQRVHSETTVRESLEAALSAILGTFDANRAALVVREEKRQRTFLWEAKRTPGTQGCVLSWEELETFQQQRYFFSLPGNSCYAIRRPAQPFDVLSLGTQGERLGRVSYTFPDYFLAWHVFMSLLVVSFTLGEEEEWSGRLFLFDPRAAGDRQAELRLLRDLVREAGPAVYTVYRLRRLRSRASGMERARIARELHDGVIQTLVGVEMRIDVLRRRAAINRAAADELSQIQRLLRGEILSVRELMQAIKSADLTSRTLLENVGELVKKFQRDTGISATLVADTREVALPPLLAREVMRIVGEALANVWKHSGARNAVVRFASKDGLWQLVIEDDGRGFDFSGRWSQGELDAAHKGPVVIKERVRSIGGELAVESTPGHGARVEITIAQNAE
jgi:signal transduction histidine kinase